MDYAYSPYKDNKGKKSRIKLPFKLPASGKKWILLFLGIIFTIFIIFYICLGQLRFFANHFLGLTFFSKHYVVVLQNNYELRPGGGFVTGYGNVDTFMGFVTNVEFKNSYDIETESYVTPPYPHEDFLKNEWYPGYGFRDANWYPHFPDTVKELSKFYKVKYPKKDIDGFIVVNFSVIEDMVDKFGGIELQGKNLNKSNLFSELEFAVNNIDRHNVEALSNRKNILGDLSTVLIKKAKYHPFSARDVVVTALNNKDMYIWLKSNRLQKKLVEKGWANTLVQPEKSDFLAVNLANMGSKKADRYIQPEVNYYVDLSSDTPQVTAEVTIRYPGKNNMYSADYKGYLRVYVPKNATVDSKPVDSIDEKNDSFAVVGTKFKLPAGSKTTLTYKYSLPRIAFQAGNYKLRLIKQSGIDTLYKVNVEVAQGKSTQSKQFKTLDNKAFFSDFLKNDLDLELNILPDKQPPYPTYQGFKSLTKIHIVWNESIDKLAVKNPTNYTISDLNKENKILDQISITQVNIPSPDTIELILKGVTDQNLEHYRVDMKGIKDVSGNLILPNPKSITVVQRIQAVTTPNTTSSVPLSTTTNTTASSVAQ